MLPSKYAKKTVNILTLHIPVNQMSPYVLF